MPCVLWIYIRNISSPPYIQTSNNPQNINSNSPLLQIRNPRHPLLRITYHLHKQIRKRRPAQLRILAPVQIPIIYSLLIARIAEARCGRTLRRAHENCLMWCAGGCGSRCGGLEILPLGRRLGAGCQRCEVRARERAGHLDGLDGGTCGLGDRCGSVAADLRLAGVLRAAGLMPRVGELCVHVLVALTPLPSFPSSIEPFR